MNIDMRRMILRPAFGLGLVALALALTSGRRAGAVDQKDIPLSADPAVQTDSHWIETEGSDASKTPEAVIRSWPETPRKTARMMIEKYGRPNRYSEDSLVWVHNGPWEKTVVYREAWPHSAVKRDKDYLKQVIGYHVPEDKVDSLRRFDRRLEVDKETNEVSFQSESERTNFLALNLADEIATDKRSVEDARDFFRKTESFASSGKSSQYCDGLLFSPANERVITP